MQASEGAGESAPRTGLYALIILAGSCLLSLLLQLLPDATGVLGLVLLATVVLALVAWVRVPGGHRTAPLLGWFLLSLLVLWIFLMALLVFRQEEISFTAILLPILVAMLWLKPLSREAATWVADGLALALVGVVTVSLAAEVLGLVDSWYGLNGVDLAADERSRYWTPLAGLLGLDGRWAGPFVHPNLAGPVGAFLLVYGITRFGWRRILYVGGGVLVLVLASSRTAMLATVAGLVTLAAVWWIRRPSSTGRWVRGAIVAVPALAAIAVIVQVNPGLTGRTTVWPVMADLWRSHPVLGIGNAGFTEAIEQGLLFTWSDHAHNVFFDALVRTGLVGFGLVLCVTGLAVALTARGAGHGRGVGIALMVTLIVGSLADTIIHWRFVTVPVSALILAVLMSADQPVSSATGTANGSAPPPVRVPVQGSDPGPDPAPTA